MSARDLLLDARQPPAVAGIDLFCGDVTEAIERAGDAVLVHADPPWVYRNAGVEGAASTHYALLSMSEIAQHVGATQAAGRRLALWTTWPTLGEWQGATNGWPWGSAITGGAWTKSGRAGIGFHWLGNSEPVLVYATGRTYTDRGEPTINAHVSPRGRHSEKPVEWLRAMVRRWTRPGDLVLDLYAGMAPMARAVALEGRRYVGAEIDPARHAAASALLAQTVSQHRPDLLLDGA